jgi:hypothetical protein
MARATTSAIAFFVLLSSAGCGSSGSAAPETVAASGEEFVLRLVERDGSRESGRVIFTPLGRRTKVVLELRGRASQGSEPRPAHIHIGSCAELEPRPAYLLAAVAEGKSTSTVAVTLSDLRAGSFAVDVHESTAQSGMYAACGDLVDALPRNPDPLGHDKVDDA